MGSWPFRTHLGVAPIVTARRREGPRGVITAVNDRFVAVSSHLLVDPPGYMYFNKASSEHTTSLDCLCGSSSAHFPKRNKPRGCSRVHRRTEVEKTSGCGPFDRLQFETSPSCRPYARPELSSRRPCRPCLPLRRRLRCPSPDSAPAWLWKRRPSGSSLSNPRRDLVHIQKSAVRTVLPSRHERRQGGS